MNPMNLCKYWVLHIIYQYFINNSTWCSRYHALSGVLWYVFIYFKLKNNFISVICVLYLLHLCDTIIIYLFLFYSDTFIYYFFKMSNLKIFYQLYYNKIFHRTNYNTCHIWRSKLSKLVITNQCVWTE